MTTNGENPHVYSEHMVWRVSVRLAIRIIAAMTGMLVVEFAT